MVIGFIADPTVKESDLPPQLQGNLWTNDAHRVIDAIRDTRPETQWRTEWHLGAKVYRESLKFKEPVDGRVSGFRYVSTNDEDDKTYRVSGYKREGFWFLEYHEESDLGGGTILIRRTTDRRLSGVVVSVDCDNGNIRCIANQWLRSDREEDHQKSWQIILAEFR